MLRVQFRVQFSTKKETVRGQSKLLPLRSFFFFRRNIAHWSNSVEDSILFALSPGKQKAKRYLLYRIEKNKYPTSSLVYMKSPL